jgi:hypothetical protein
MCKCKILEAANVDAYLFDNMVIEELAIQDVVKATTMDFAYTVDRLKRTPENPFLLRHVYELMQFMQSDECFRFMDMEPDTYIEMMLAGAGLSVKDVLKKVFHNPTNVGGDYGVKNASGAMYMAGIMPEKKLKRSYNIHGGCYGCT